MFESLYLFLKEKLFIFLLKIKMCIAVFEDI